MSIAIAIILLVFTSAMFGVTMLLSYMLQRVMKNDDWDDSNITNALRLLSHVVLHPEDFGKMYYLTEVQKMQLMSLAADGDENIPMKRPFWYVAHDELSEVVKTRP